MSHYNFTSEQLADARAGKIVQLTPEQDDRLRRAQEAADLHEQRRSPLEDRIEKLESQVRDLIRQIESLQAR
jgi:hypothetical protein